MTCEASSARTLIRTHTAVRVEEPGDRSERDAQHIAQAARVAAGQQIRAALRGNA